MENIKDSHGEVNVKAQAKKNRLKMYRRIFLVSLKIGAFTFGGGYAMIPLMQDEFVDNQHWIEEKDIVDVFAVAQSLPGVISVNASVLIGYKIAGMIGGLAAVLGVVLPSFVILSIIAFFYGSFADNEYISGALRGISAAVVALMLSAILRLRKQSLLDMRTWVLAAMALAFAIFAQNISLVYVIIGGGVAGLVLKLPELLR